jgi:hypothetical protein
VRPVGVIKKGSTALTWSFSRSAVRTGWEFVGDARFVEQVAKRFNGHGE